jgi:hypothetical protein
MQVELFTGTKREEGGPNVKAHPGGLGNCIYYFLSTVYMLLAGEVSAMLMFNFLG